MEDEGSSRLGRYFLEAQRRREEARKLKMDPPEPVIVPEPVTVEDSDIVKQAIAKISVDIKDPLEFVLAELEESVERFTQAANDNNVIEIIRELEFFSERIGEVRDLLQDFIKEIMDVYTQTKRGIDAQNIINKTFSKKEIEEEIRSILELLRKASENAIQVRYDVPKSKEVASLLQNIFNYGEEHFDYEAPEVKVEMDVSRDAEIARRLAEETGESGEGRSRFESIGRSIPATFPPPPRRAISRPPLGLTEASGIVRSNPEIDLDTMRQILVSQGFNTDVIRESLRARTPLSVPRNRILERLSFDNLRQIADLYGLSDYEGMSKSEFIAYIQRNIEISLLRDIVREIFGNNELEFKNIPIIYSE